ncbi:NmrA family NAD(P)-binding protein [Streptomyces sp. NPDC088789]|uniref:NmrA family NAD(P)-binding protein n=1 Tax=Streptomyces sp. NPDC088789 TaxID=3365899 RepID=UPI0038108F98
MTPASPILVTGATGKQGGATVRRLLVEGRPVRALVREPDSPAAGALAAHGARLVCGDFDDPASLRAALDGVAGVFGVPPVAYGPDGPETRREAERGRALIDAAAAAGVEQVVFSTIASVSPAWRGTPGTPLSQGKALIEEYLHDRIALPTVLRPVRFMTNYLGTGMTGIDDITGGVHRHLFPPDEPLQMIALEDVAEFAALAFADPARFAGRTLELAGDAPTPVAAVAAITEATGVPLRYRQLTDAEATALGQEVAGTKRRWDAGERWHADIEALRVVHPGLRTFADWLDASGADSLRARLTAG